LGEFTNELDEDDYITEFVSAGPKNYAYVTFKGKCKCVVKCFTQNLSTMNKINFEEIKHIVLNQRDKKIKVTQLKFKRNRVDWVVECNVEDKIYSFVYDKRVLFNDLTTKPFGYR
jgi:hypothetical protein